jgi:hypothetical protein
MNACECMWMPMSEWEHPLNTHWVCMNANEWVGTAPEHPLSADEFQWVSVNTHWMHMTAIESLLNATHRGVTMRRVTFLWESNSPWMRLSVRELMWVSIEHPLNAVECTWMHLRECWTPPERYRLCVNPREWVLNSPWTPIEFTWMPLSKYFKGLKAHL